MLRMDNLLRWFPKAVSKLQDKIDLTNLLVSIKQQYLLMASHLKMLNPKKQFPMQKQSMAKTLVSTMLQSTKTLNSTYKQN